jgi:hypothetical protein
MALKMPAASNKNIDGFFINERLGMPASKKAQWPGRLMAD